MTENDAVTRFLSRVRDGLEEAEQQSDAIRAGAEDVTTTEVVAKVANTRALYALRTTDDMLAAVSALYDRVEMFGESSPGSIAEALEVFDNAIAAARAMFVSREDAPLDPETFRVSAAAVAVQLVDGAVKGTIGALLAIRDEIAAATPADDDGFDVRAEITRLDRKIEGYAADLQRGIDG